MWPELVKRTAGSPVAAVIERALRRTDLQSGVVVLYHRVTPVGGNPEMELSPGIPAHLAERQIDHLRRNYRPIALDHLVEEVVTREPGTPFPVAVTFDDDSVEHLEIAVPILQRLGLPATFFLCGPNHPPFWWENVNRALRCGVTVEQIGALIPSSEGDGRAPRTVSELGSAFEGLVPKLQASVLARLDDLCERKATGQPQPTSATLATCLAGEGFNVGFHTRGHQRLTLLDDAELEAAMRDGLEELEAATGADLEAIAYPHGWADTRVADSARRAGFRLGLTTEPRALTPTTDPLMIPRCDALGFGPSLAGFELGIAKRLLDAWLEKRWRIPHQRHREP